MDESRKDFGDRLLEAEAVNSELKARYQRAVRALLEMELRGVRRIVPILVLVFSLTVAVIFGMAAVMSWTGGMPLLARMTFVLAAAFGAAVVVLMLWVLGRGAINLRVGSTVAGVQLSTWQASHRFKPDG